MGEDAFVWRRWEQVDRLFAAALDVPAEERASLVERMAGGDAELVAAVLRLLALDEADGGPELLEGALRQAFRLDPPGGDPGALEPGTMVDRYRITGWLGRGGMATVHVAERADGTYQEEVALKVLRRGLDTADLVARFRNERQLLSRLAHPNITRILDGGETPDGRPYLVLELVRGAPITAWADAQRLSVERRIALFLQVADAVEVAHRHLVVHRDLKPSNVLVDESGRAKLLDFGIAKLLDDEADHTRTGIRPLTPSHAAPEQLHGGTITTATDVYQLGLLLRELLTGMHPSPEEASSGREPMGLVRAATTATPSASSIERARARGLTLARLQGRLRGDLDVIVGKALRADPEARYHSAGALAGDLRRHLDGRPIAAMAPSPGYLLGRFLGRHRWVAPTAVAAGLAVSLFTGMLVRHNRELTRERDAATRASQLASETQGFLLGLFRSADPMAPADPERGSALTVVEAMDLGLARLDADLPSGPLRTELTSTIAGVYLSLGRSDKAGPLLETVLADRRGYGDTTSPAFVDDLGRYGDYLRGVDAIDSAVAVLERRVAIERARDPVDPARLGPALLELGLVTRRQQPRETVARSREAVAILRPVGGAPLGEALRRLADDLREVGDGAAAEAAAREAVTLIRAARGAGAPQTAYAIHSLAQAIALRGRLAESQPLYRESLAILERRLGADHPTTLTMRGNLASQALEMGHFDEAEAEFRRLIALRSGQLGEEHSTVASLYQNLAATLLRAGRHAAADSAAVRAGVIYARVLPAGHILRAFPRLTRAEILLAAGEPLRAGRLAGEAAAMLRDQVPVTHPAAVMADCRLGRAMAATGDRDGALVLLDSVVERLDRSEGLGPRHRTECEAARDSLVGADQGT